MPLEDFVGMFAMPALNVPAVPAIPQFTLTFAPIVTRGYESSKRDVRIEGAGILGGMNYRVSEGPLQGMNFFLAADKGREKRDGSALGDRLNYWDVKMSIQYDFMLK